MHVSQIHKSYHNSNLKQETDTSQWVFKFRTQQIFRNVNFVLRVFAMYQVSYLQRHRGQVVNVGELAAGYTPPILFDDLALQVVES